MGLVASKIENMKISVSVNPKGAMRSIMYVLDDFAGFGSFSYISRVFSKMDLKIKFFDFLHIIYFRNPEIERFRPLPIFFGSEVI